MHKFIATLLSAGIAFGFSASTASAEKTNEEIAREIALLLRVSRSVISKSQTQINRTDIADKGINAALVLTETREKFLDQAGIDLNDTSRSTREGLLLSAFQKSVREVMDSAQPLINRTDIGMKGFLPAVYAREVSRIFSQNSNGAAKLKLTAPKAYVRNRANRPDSWEHNAIENVLKAPGHVQGAHYSEVATVEGKPAYRLIFPEYYGTTCLNCHGEPKGELDVTGGKKEGGKLGELGGAISVVLFDIATEPASR